MGLDVTANQNFVFNCVDFDPPTLWSCISRHKREYSFIAILRGREDADLRAVGFACRGLVVRDKELSPLRRQTDRLTDRQTECRNILCFAEFRQNWVIPETDSIFGHAAILCCPYLMG